VSTQERFGPLRPARPDEGQPPAASGSASQKLAAGVPLGKFIPRELIITPEVVMVTGARTPAAERFRRLKTLLTHDVQEEPQVIVVTSALPGEGKSLVSMNLALAFAADTDGETLLIDADIRRPGIDRWFKPAPKIGLSEILSGEAEPEHGLLEIKAQHLIILPAGQPARDPVPLLSSGYAKSLIESMRKRFKRIVIDTPPIVPFTDADITAALSDGVVVVARSKMTPKPLLQQALNSVTSSRILGVVLNDTTYSLADHYRHYDGYYSKYYTHGDDE
jgi:capsular exopolysaccharide synthesis family protein